MNELEDNTAGLYCITIKGISPRECHYLSTSIFVQMAPNLLPPTTTTAVFYVEMLTQNSAVKATNQLNSTLKILPITKKRSRLSMFPACDAAVDQAQTDGEATTLASI